MLQLDNVIQIGDVILFHLLSLLEIEIGCSLNQVRTIIYLVIVKSQVAKQHSVGFES